MKTSSEIGLILSPERRALRRKIWAITLPIMLANITIPFVGMVDTAVMGHLGSPHFIGAVALGSFVFSLITTAFGFLRMATTGLVAQAYGAEDTQAVFRHLFRAVFIAVNIGLLILILSRPFLEVARFLLTASEEVLDGMEVYISILAFAGPAICFNMVMLGMFFGLQRIKYCMIQLIVINCLNIIGNLVFVFGFGLTIDGVALATVLAQYMGAGVSVALLFGVLGPPSRWARPVAKDFMTFAALHQYASLGRDLTIRTLAIVLAEVLVLNVAGGIDDVTLAASQLCFVVFAILAYSLDGFAHAAEALTGAAIGRRDPRELRLAIRESTLMALITAMAMAMVVAIGGGVFMRFLTSLPEVLELVDSLLIWLVVMPVISVMAFQMDGVFIGATQAKVMRNAMLVSLIVFIPLLYLGRHIAGIDGIWVAFLVLLGLRGLTLWLNLDIVIRAAGPVRS
ncbi:MATE family efflux transporter [Alphaproteobacteria bacterium LSUCC0684]